MDMYVVSEKENFRLAVLLELKSGRLSRPQAARQMEVSLRQLDRIKSRFLAQGVQGLVHRNRGRKSNRAMPLELNDRILSLVREHYPDFGPTHASEKLSEIHGIQVSSEKLRQMMMAEKLWKGRKRKRVRAYQRRPRRSCRGELLQGDASPHDWFEGRAPRCNLVSFIDDATGHVTARFEPSEDFEGYCRLLKEYLDTHGCPRALYVDKSSIFRVNSGKNSGGTDTAFGRILKDLRVDLIYAHSPQAKGRVERMYSTFQDRVVKEMRLANVCSIKEANDFLESYLKIYNKRFAKEAASDHDAHVPVPAELDLYRTFTKRKTRKLSKSLEFSFDGVLYQVKDCSEPRRLMNQPVTVFVALDGGIWAECRGKRLNIQAYHELESVPPTLDRKQVDAWLNRKAPMTVKQKINRKVAYPR